MDVSYAVDDIEVKAMLRELERKAKSMKPAMQDVSVYMKREVMDNFKAQGRPNKWQPLSERYASFKSQSAGSGKPILEFHGKLKQSINAKHTNNNAMVRTGVLYGVYHQTGTRKMPARPFMPDSKNPNIPPFDSKGIGRIKQIIELYLTREVNV